jgi:FtsP/CotA-like multicopper oxidase with cupredoxin domain
MSKGYDGTEGPLGPCLTANPGQTMNIKVINNMKDGMEILKQTEASQSQYWEMAQDPADDLDNITWYGSAAKTPEEMEIIDAQDLPGYDATFDDVNLHLHGMQVVPHLFYPQGTGNATSEWITITPTNENPDQQCFCYVFEIPEDNPQGNFFYHIHRHGSTAMQAWQGMFGELFIGNSTTPGGPEYELSQQGITRSEPLVTWEWAVNASTPFNTTTDENGNTIDAYAEGQFLGDQEQYFLTNNEYQPTFNMTVNETVHFQLLCAQTTTGAAFFVLDENDNHVPFWVFAADAISFDKAYKKDSIVIGPGQREGVLLQFNQAGTYRIMQIVINDFQNTGEDVTDKDPAAFISVEEPCQVGNSLSSCDGHRGAEGKQQTMFKQIPPVDISSLTFTPGMRTQITPEEITHQVSVGFVVQSQLDMAPVPQFAIDGKLFDYTSIQEVVQAGTASEWTLTSNMDYFHPFHIHVNPFQVKEVYTGYLPGVLPTGETLEESVKSTIMEPANQWRDVTFIPPFGMVKTYQKFGASIAWAGKTVFHCHFLDHEDQGMIAAMMISDPNAGETGNTRGRRLRGGK